MSKSAGSTQAVSSTSPPSFQQPYIDKLLSEASRLYGSPGPQYYPNSTVAPQTTDQLGGQGMLREAAGDVNAFTKTQAYPTAQRHLNASDVANNPYVKAYAEAATRPIMQQFTEEILPNIRTSAVGVGGYGGSRQGIGEALATERVARAMADATSGIYNQAYSQGLQTEQGALSQLPTLAGASMIPGQVLSSIGDVNQAQKQAEIEADKARWDWGQMLPYQKLAEYGSAISGSYGGQGTSEVKATGSTAGQTAAGAVAGGLTLLDLLRSIFNW